MAKAKTKEPTSVNDIFKNYAKRSGKFEIADESAALQDKGFIGTGSMALNSIMGGSLFKGVKKGGITAFAGRESTGKTFICKSIIREAQKEGMGVIIFDTEGAYTNADLKKSGIKTDQILFQAADTVTNFQVDCCNILKELNEENPEMEWLVILDSLANLITNKESEDTYKKGDPKSDQGQRAKQLKAASRIIQKAVSSHNGTLVVTNHTYESPGAYPGIPPEQIFSGGSGFLYMAHQIVFLKKYNEKEEIATLEGAKKKKESTGIRVTAITKKNRCCPEDKLVNFYINYKNGLLPYPGLLDYGAKYGFIEPQAAGWYFIPHLDKKVRGAAQVYSDEVWKPIVDKLNEKIEEDFAFPDAGNDALLADIENDADELESEEKEKSLDED